MDALGMAKHSTSLKPQIQAESVISEFQVFWNSNWNGIGLKPHLSWICDFKLLWFQSFKFRRFQLKWDWLEWKMACTSAWCVRERSSTTPPLNATIMKNIFWARNATSVLTAVGNIPCYATWRSTCPIFTKSLKRCWIPNFYQIHD